MFQYDPLKSTITRQTAKEYIRDQIKYHRECLEGLEKLLKNLPEDLDPQADMALWNLLAEHRGFREF